ncbi:MAG: hypothetical protein BGO23_05260 [Solirubrobacterales bacterium 67-14]|nr:MAG: hypothetical protein BGO23_05260 [Solirubrobacterales bacterium 67-14]
MAETAGASSDSAQRALLDLVRDSDVFLLILGEVYGEAGDSGFSPTEDEYNEAVRLGKPILVLKQDVDLEQTQEEFLARIRGTWEQGKLTGTFTSAEDVGTAVIRALRTLDGPNRPASQEQIDGASARVLELVSESRSMGGSSASIARIGITPAKSTIVLGATELDDPAIVDQILGEARVAISFEFDVA